MPPRRKRAFLKDHMTNESLFWTEQTRWPTNVVSCLYVVVYSSYVFCFYGILGFSFPYVLTLIDSLHMNVIHILWLCKPLII